MRPAHQITFVPSPPRNGRAGVGPVAPGDVLLAGTREDLRAALFPELVTGHAAWIAMEGLGVARRESHARLLRQVARFRRASHELVAPVDPSAEAVPHTAVLDWTDVRGVGASDLAEFPLVVDAVRRSGAALLCCDPRDAATARALEQSGLVAATRLRWLAEDWAEEPSALRHVGSALVPTMRVPWQRHRGRVSAGPPPRGSGRERSLAPPASVRPVLVVPATQASGRLLAAFARHVADVARRVGADEEAAGRLQALILELAVNALGCAHASRVAASAVYHPAAHPLAGARLEVAVADDGIGIAARFRRDQARKGFAASTPTSMPERLLVTEVLRGVHDPDVVGPGRGAGRGLVVVTRGLLRAADAAVTLRSGGVWLRHSSTGQERAVVASASRGLGTQVVIDVRLPQAFAGRDPSFRDLWR